MSLKKQRLLFFYYYFQRQCKLHKTNEDWGKEIKYSKVFFLSTCKVNTSRYKMLFMINIICQNLFHTFVYKSYLMNVRRYPDYARGLFFYPRARGVKWRREKWPLTGFLGRVFWITLERWSFIKSSSGYILPGRTNLSLSKVLVYFCELCSTSQV